MLQRLRAARPPEVTVRLIHCTTPQGLVRVLATNLLDATTGLSWHTHEQDLAAKVLADNLAALL